jgi:hypothetical protein
MVLLRPGWENKSVAPEFVGGCELKLSLSDFQRPIRFYGVKIANSIPDYAYAAYICPA